MTGLGTRLTLLVGIVSAYHCVAQSLLELVIANDGSYTVSVGGSLWFESFDTILQLPTGIYSAKDSTLKFVSNTTATGKDGIGQCNETTITWQATDPASTPMITSFSVYASGSTVAFTTTFPAGTPPQPWLPSNSTTGGLVATFPTFVATPLAPSPLGEIYHNPDSSNCGWMLSGGAFPQASGGLMVLSPAIASDAPSAERVAVGFAALTQQTVVKQAVLGNNVTGFALAAGPGAQYALPPGFSSSFIMTSVSAENTNRAGGNPYAVSRADWGLVSIHREFVFNPRSC